MIESADPVEQAAHRFLTSFERSSAWPSVPAGRVASALSTLRCRLEATTIAAPSCAAACAVAKPMPDVPPRITMRLSFKVISISFGL
jgi:hypothetical protein